MAEKRYRVTVDLGKELGVKVEEAAKKKYLKLPDFIRMAVAQYFSRFEKKSSR